MTHESVTGSQQRMKPAIPLDQKSAMAVTPTVLHRHPVGGDERKAASAKPVVTSKHFIQVGLLAKPSTASDHGETAPASSRNCSVVCDLAHRRRPDPTASNPQCWRKPSLIANPSVRENRGVSAPTCVGTAMTRVKSPHASPKPRHSPPTRIRSSHHSR